MTEIQRTKVEVCNQIIAQLGQDKPFMLSLNADQTKAFYEVSSSSHHINSRHIKVLVVATWQLSLQNKGCSIEVDEQNFDAIYHMLASYIAKHDLPEDVVQSLGEIA